MTVPFSESGGSSELWQAGYQNPNRGAFFDGLISVIGSAFIEGGRARERTSLGCSRSLFVTITAGGNHVKTTLPEVSSTNRFSC